MLGAGLWMGAGAASADPPRGLLIAISEPDWNGVKQRLLALIAKAAHLEWQVLVVPWARLMAMVTRGEALAFGLSHTSQRDALFEFSDSVLPSRVWAVSSGDAALRLQGAKGLAEHVVCTRLGVSYGEEIDAILAKSRRTVVIAGDAERRLRMNQLGRCDLTLYNSRLATAAEVERRLHQRLPGWLAVNVHPSPLHVDSMHFAVARGHPQAAVMERINHAIHSQREAIMALAEAAG